MSDWILDTDHVSLFLRGDQRVIEATERHGSNVMLTIITVQELFNGWVGRINQEEVWQQFCREAEIIHNGTMQAPPDQQLDLFL